MKNNITCPNCGNEINVNEILYHEIEDKVNSNFQKQIKAKEKEFEAKETKMKKELEASIRKVIEKKYEKENENLQEKLKKQANELSDMNKIKAEAERLKKEKAEIEKKVVMKVEKEMEQKMKQQLAKFAEDIQKKTEADMERKLKEKDTVINQLKKIVTEAKQKAEQGSIQLQGEAQEICIEERLKKMFPEDEILEVKKGVRGGDCIHNVLIDGKKCATIYYESKRTKAFQNSWIEKLKDDMKRERANVGVLITETMPAGTRDFVLIDGIFVCSYSESKYLCGVIRELVLRAYSIYASNKNRNDKMELLYDYLTGDEFRMNIETVFNKLADMKLQIIKEKEISFKQWKKREEQIQTMLSSVAGVCLSVKQITGKSLPEPEADNYLLQA